jgi:hypothetical protein
MREAKTSIAPEVQHLLAAVKAVKRGLVPELSKLPPIPDTEVDIEESQSDEGEKD